MIEIIKSLITNSYFFQQGQGEQFYDYNHGAYAAPHKAPEYSPPIKVPSYPAA